jgi:hypothetical protein
MGGIGWELEMTTTTSGDSGKKQLGCKGNYGMEWKDEGEGMGLLPSFGTTHPSPRFCLNTFNPNVVAGQATFSINCKGEFICPPLFPPGTNCPNDLLVREMEERRLKGK